MELQTQRRFMINLVKEDIEEEFLEEDADAIPLFYDLDYEELDLE